MRRSAAARKIASSIRESRGRPPRVLAAGGDSAFITLHIVTELGRGVGVCGESTGDRQGCRPTAVLKQGGHDSACGDVAVVVDGAARQRDSAGDGGKRDGIQWAVV